jgi:uncharacterized repeat protein (TIGR03803 family)
MLACGRKYCMRKKIMFALVIFGGVFAVAQNNFKVIHSFSGPDGSQPIGSVVFDGTGNLYGTAPGGGTYSHGVVYELSPSDSGDWTETTLYSFCQKFDGLSCLDGAYPSAGLALDAAGNIYGVAGFGGTGDELGNGGGVFFELSPPQQKGGTWTETVLYNFCSDDVNNQCLDGSGPTSQLVFDATGNFYGTTAGGGTGHVKYGAGTVFKLSPGSGTWTETVLYNFCSQGQGTICPDGEIPTGGVTLDRSGNLFGTTDYSGDLSSPTGGTLYELAPSQTGWEYKQLLSAPPKSGLSGAEASVSLDPMGNLYSTIGGKSGGGVFRLNPKTGKLATFAFHRSNGGPQGGVFVDIKTNAIYGTTLGNGVGDVFAINTLGEESVLHNFCSEPNCTDGSLPWATLVPDKAGHLYGTTEFGGDYNGGVVFEIAP